MTGKELELLQWFAEGHELLTEYNDDDTWKAAAALCKLGLLDANGVITGTVRFNLTGAGQEMLRRGDRG